MTDLHRITLRIPEYLLERVDTAAERDYDGNRSALIREAIEEMLEPELIADGGQLRERDEPTRRQALAWQDVGQKATWLLFANAQADLDDALAPIDTALETDRPVDETAIRQTRRELDTLRRMLEDYIVPLSDGEIEPWDGGAGGTVPYRVFREHLESAGYDVTPPGGEDAD